MSKNGKKLEQNYLDLVVDTENDSSTILKRSRITIGKCFSEVKFSAESDESIIQLKKYFRKSFFLY